ncbi:MAG: cellulase family glycosylhydrolase [Oscillospiraceae bacterium]|nr:cellulase family glycosylhydrolase [Oscillospiraceae bacterium]
MKKGFNENMKKCVLSLILTLSLSLALVPAVILKASAGTFTPVTGRDMAERLGLGINIGNTLEARPWTGSEPLANPLDAETIWGAPRIEKWHFEAIAVKGFSNVRIPVSWEPHMDRNGRISPAFMSRVQQCVDWALEAGLIVTLNTHHEDALYDLMLTDYEGARSWLLGVWTQVADRFKDYPETLIFEPMNEPRPGRTGWYWCYTRYEAEIPILMETSNKLNRDALALIRGSGGNNAQRIVALTVVQADPNLLYLYEHPADDPYTMVGVFFYPATAALEKNALEQIKAALDKGIPVVIKETSPIERTGAGALTWSRNTYEELAALGVPSMWWNCTGYNDDELFIRATGVWNDPLVNIFFTAYGERPGPSMTPPPPPLPYLLDGIPNGTEFTFWNNINPGALDNAGKMVVEYEGSIHNAYAFTRFTSQWVQFDNGHDRITAEPGKIIFDIRGLAGGTLGIGMWVAGDSSKVTRIYLDTWEGSGEISEFSTADALNILRYIAGLITLSAEQQSRYDMNGDGKIDTSDALMMLSKVAGVYTVIHLRNG